MSTIFAAIDPAMIVLGGPLPQTLTARIVERVTLTNPERRGFHRLISRIVPSNIHGDSASIGAATLPLRAAFFDTAVRGNLTMDAMPI